MFFGALIAQAASIKAQLNAITQFQQTAPEPSVAASRTQIYGLYIILYKFVVYPAMNHNMFIGLQN